GNATRTRTWVIKNTGNVTTNQSRVIRWYNCKGAGHIAKLCTQPKRAQNSKWFEEKMLLAQAQEARVILDEEQLAFLAYTGERVNSGSDAQALTTAAIFQTDDMDAFDSDSNEAPIASAVFIENLSAYDSNILSEVPNYDTYQDNNVIK
nr:hypothetical protein [Tanacetum cinerariifolium]